MSGCHIRSDAESPPRRASTPFLVSDRWGYAPAGAWGRQEVYDLVDDPLATTDVAAEYPEVVADLHHLFMSHLVAHGAPPETLSLWKNAESRAGRAGSWAIDYPHQTL